MKRTLYIFILLVFLGFGASAQNVKSSVIINREPSEKLVKFYPNPATEYINFEIAAYDRSYSLQIYNFIGKKLMEIRPGAPAINVPLTDFYRGIYVFQLRDQSGRILDSGKFQVVK